MISGSRKMSLFAVTVMLLCAVLCCGHALAASDGYIEEKDTFSIADFGNLSKIIGYKGVPATQHTKNGNRYSIHWSNQTENPQIRIDLDANTPDLADYSRLKMWIYSEKATNATIKCVFTCPDDASGGRYFHKDFVVDWTGFKLVTVNFPSMEVARSADWHDVYRFSLYAHGAWGMVADSQTDLYIASIDVVKLSNSDSLLINYNEEAIEQTYADLKDSVGLYAGGKNAATSEGAKPLGYTLGWSDKTLTVPVSLFGEFFGAEVSDDTESFSVKMGDTAVSGRAGSKTVTVNGTKKELNTAAYAEDGRIYLPGEEIAQILGMSTCADGKFLLIGTETAAKAMHRKAGRGVNYETEIAAYLSYHTDKSQSAYTEEDYKKVLSNWREYRVGNREINNTEDVNIAYGIKSLDVNVDSILNSFIRDDNSDALFSDLKITTTANMTTAYKRIRYMAYAYETYGSKYYKNETVRDYVLYGMGWMYQRYYGINEINGNSWTPTGLNNWFDWDIGTPECIVDVLVVMEDEFTAEEITKYLAYFDKKFPMPKLSTTGSNFVEIDACILASGLLQRNYERVNMALNYLEQSYFFVDDNLRFNESYLDSERQEYTPMKSSGFFTDGSYLYHTLHAMNGTYGRGHFNDICRLEAILGGTAFELNSPVRDNLPEFFFNNMSTAVYGTAMYRMFMGREENINNINTGIAILGGMLSCADSFEADIRDRVYSVVKGAYLTYPTNVFFTSLNFSGIAKLNEILADDDIVPENERYINHVYYNSDKVVHEQGDWAIGIGMSSSRIFNYESINNQNLDGWYLGDGRTEYYVKGSADGANSAYWNNIDKYRLPGTTVDTQEREKVSVSQGNEYLSSKDFVGGVSLEGVYGVAAMDLESYHADEPIGTANTHGGENPVHKNDLTALKGYFMFDDSVVCLGAEVNAKDNNDAEVLTVADNRAASGIRYNSNDDASAAYEIKSVYASETPEPDNTAEGTIDDSMSTKWTSEAGAYIVWDLGEVKNLGFAALSFQRGTERSQQFELHLSSDGEEWTEVFNGSSSGKQDVMECFDLGATDARYVKFVNLGNSVSGNTWVSLCDCKIYAPNADGAIAVSIPEAYGADEFIADGKAIDLLGEDYDLSGITWANIGGKCGYYFPKENSDNLGELKARWTKGVNSFFELWFSHGVNPTGSSYAYVLLPGKSAEYTKEYAEAENISVLANNGSVQAVYNKKLAVTGIIFREAGTFGKITVDKPCIMMYRETDELFNIAVSDPTQKLSEINITVDGDMSELETDECAAISSSDGKTYINIDMSDSVGRTFENRFKKN